MRNLCRIREIYFSSCHGRGTKNKFRVPARNRTSDLRIPRSDAPTTEPQRRRISFSIRTNCNVAHKEYLIFFSFLGVDALDRPRCCSF